MDPESKYMYKGIKWTKKRNAEILDKTRRSTTKATGGDDTVAWKSPAGILRNDFVQVGEKFGPQTAHNKASKRQESAIRRDDQSKAYDEQLIEIRDIMQIAYEKFVGNIEDKSYKPKRIEVMDEIKFYATRLIGHWQKGWHVDLKSKEENMWKKKQLRHVVEDIVKEVKKEADNAWDPIQKCNMDGNEEPADVSAEVEQLTSCLNEIKRHKQDLIEKIEKLRNASYIILNAPNEKQHEVNNTKSKEEENGEKRNISTQLQDITQQLHSITEILEQEKNHINYEVSQCEKEMDGFTETFGVSMEDTIRSGLQKRIRLLREKLDSNKKKLKTSMYKKSVKESKEAEDKENLIKTRITKVWRSMTDASMVGHDSRQQRYLEPVDMLDDIEASFINLKQELDRFERKNACIEKGLKELASDVDGLTKTQQVKCDELMGEGKPKMIHDIRLQLNDKKHDLLERYEKEQACIYKELKDFREDVKDLRKKRHIESDELIGDGIQKDIRQLRLKLERQKWDFSERQVIQQDELKWLMDLWNIVSEEGGAKKYVTGGAAGDSDIEEMRNIVLQNIKRWKSDRLQVVSVSVPVLEGISCLLTKEPFNFSDPKQLDSHTIVRGISPALHPVFTGIHWINQCVKENCKSLQAIRVRSEAYGDLKEKEKSLLCEIKDLKKEKDVLLNRLSKVAGANLTDNNPNIADLSDPNRATKLAEQFSELYDNPWTDAFEVLETLDERCRIGFLLNIIVGSYKACEAISQYQQEIVTKAMHRPSDGMTQEKLEKKPLKTKTIGFSRLQSKTLAELRKQCADISVADVKSFISTEHKDWITKKELEKYTMVCIELCWLMHLQSPPVYMDDCLEEGTPFDTNIHKQYTKSGKKIDYLVWPALTLHEGGPILCKGIAQGK